MGVERISTFVWNNWNLLVLLDLRSAAIENVTVLLCRSKQPYEVTNTVEWDTF